MTQTRMYSALNRTDNFPIFRIMVFIVTTRNYPCCTVNHPQAYPKFWANSFLVDQSDQSLVHAFLGPATFSGDVGSNQVEGTLVPFCLNVTLILVLVQ
jgi:hypothetical protein